MCCLIIVEQSLQQTLRSLARILTSILPASLYLSHKCFFWRIAKDTTTWWVSVEACIFLISWLLDSGPHHRNFDSKGATSCNSFAHISHTSLREISTAKHSDYFSHYKQYEVAGRHTSRKKFGSVKKFRIFRSLDFINWKKSLCRRLPPLTARHTDLGLALKKRSCEPFHCPRFWKKN